MEPNQGARRHQPKPTRVLLSVAPLSDRDNPYIKLLVGSMPRDIAVRYYTKWRAIFGTHDVFHVHWPDHLLRDRSAARTWAKRAVFATILLRCVITRTTVVRTAHNVSPHESSDSRVEHALLAWLDRISRVWIVLNRQTPLPPGAPTVMIPHGHYRDWYTTSGIERVPGRIMSFGVVRPYKNLPTLVRSARLLPDTTASLHVLGACSDPGLAAEIRNAAGDDPRICITLSHIEDEHLTREIGESTLVALPYTQLLNSGALLLALSLNRPVLVPETPATRAYRAEFGKRWVLTYTGDINAEVLASALADAETHASDEHINLDSRDWRGISRATAEIYRQTRSGSLLNKHTSKTDRAPGENRL